jgi:hypothetical protein
MNTFSMSMVWVIVAGLARSNVSTLGCPVLVAR